MAIRHVPILDSIKLLMVPQSAVCAEVHGSLKCDYAEQLLIVPVFDLIKLSIEPQLAARAECLGSLKCNCAEELQLAMQYIL